jgi:hypothetical protein
MADRIACCYDSDGRGAREAARANWRTLTAWPNHPDVQTAQLPPGDSRAGSRGGGRGRHRHDHGNLTRRHARRCPSNAGGPAAAGSRRSGANENNGESIKLTLDKLHKSARRKQPSRQPMCGKAALDRQTADTSGQVGVIERVAAEAA